MKKIILVFGLLFFCVLAFGFDNPADLLLNDFKEFLTRIPYQSIGKEISSVNATYDRTLSSGDMEYDARGIVSPSGISLQYMVSPDGVIKSITINVVDFGDSINSVMLGKYINSLAKPYRIQEKAGAFSSRYQYWQHGNGIIMVHEETWLSSSLTTLHFFKEGAIFLGSH